MAGMQAALVELDAFEVAILQKIVHSKTLGTSLQDRARIVLLAGEGLTNRQLEKDHGQEEHRVSQWRTRWHDLHEPWKRLDPMLRPKMSQKLVKKWLSDAGGRGRKPEITEEQRALIFKLFWEWVRDFSRPSPELMSGTT